MTFRSLSLLLFSCLASLLSGCDRNARGTVPSSGVLDLRALDLAEGETELDAGWRLHWGQLLVPSDFAAGREGAWISAATGKWSRFVWQGRKLPDHGFGTYRLTLLVDTARVHSLAFSTREQNSAYRLWVNGVPLLGSGTPAVSRELEQPWSEQAMGEVPLHAPRVELVLQISNFHSQYGGIGFPIHCGAAQRLRRDFLQTVIVQSMLLGIFLLIAGLWFFTWLSHRQERGFLWFALFCLVWAVIQLGDSGSEMRLFTLFSDVVSFDLGARLLISSYGFMFPLWYLFLYSQHPYRVVRWCIAIAGVLGGLCVAASAFQPVEHLNVVLRSCFLVTLLMRPVSVGVLLHAAWRRRSGAVLLLAGQIFFTTATFCDVLSAVQVLHLPYMSSYGVLMLVLAMALSLARRTASTHRSNEELLAELRSGNQELERLSRVKDDLLANTSHELRTPLHAIQGLTQAVLADPRQPLEEGTRQALDTVVGSARRLSMLVDDLLDSASLQRGDVPLRLDRTDVAGLAREAIAGLLPQAQNQGIALSMECPAALPAVRADANRILQVLTNLLANALRFTPAGHVGVRLERMGETVRIAVEDTGIGISEADQERIFERFEQAGPRRGGTGLGLAISRELVRLHGGALEVRSGKGEGSCFFFSLPVLDEEVLPDSAALPEPHEVPSTLRNGGDSRRVLAVDDEPVNLRIVQAFLEAQGIGVVPLADGSGILERIEEHGPDLVLLDVSMPEEDGFSVCRRIRERYGPQELPVLFLSARTAPEDVARGFASGGNDYVPKPFLREEFLARVEAQLRQKAAFRRLDEQEFRGRMCALLGNALQEWTALTGLTKADLAESSGLWKAHTDPNGWRRTATLDRYLEVGRLPQNPRWKPVLNTVAFVIARIERDKAEALRLEMGRLQADWERRGIAAAEGEE